MKKYKWRIYADENIDKEIIKSLRSSNIDVLWVTEDNSLIKQKDDLFHYKKARKLKRYLLTKDKDFWCDSKYLLHESPGVIIITTQNKNIASSLILLLKNLVDNYNPLDEPIYLNKLKVKLSDSGITLKILDHATQKKIVKFWNWEDLF